MIEIGFNSGKLTFKNADYQISGFQYLGSNDIHLFIKNEANSMVIFLTLESTSVNGVSFNSLAEMLSAFGNPVEIEA
jgi:hypothetical protein